MGSMRALCAVSIVLFCALHGASLLLTRPRSSRHQLHRSYSSKSFDDRINFKSLKTLLGKVEELSALETEYMTTFWCPTLNCFKLYPNIESNRISITSTCISLGTILANPKTWAEYCQWDSYRISMEDMYSGSAKLSLKDIIKALNDVPWSLDPFQTPTLLHTLLSLNAYDDIDPEKYKMCIETCLEQRSRLSLHRKQLHSAYLRYVNVKALLLLVEKRQAIPSDLVGTNRIGYSLERANLVAFDELCRQLAFYESGDNANFDVIILTYTLLTYYETSQSLFLNSFARGVVPAVNLKLCTAALEIIFASQKEDGTWAKGEPIFGISDSKSNRDIGNSYVFFFDFIGSMLSCFSEKHPMLLAPYLPQLERCLGWAQANVLQEMLPEECDPITNRCYGDVVKGWRSNHLGTGGAVCWCTAQVFYALSGMKKLIQILIFNNVLTEFSGKATGNNIGSSKEWDSLMDADLYINNEVVTLKSILYPRLIKPQIMKEMKLQSTFNKKAEYKRLDSNSVEDGQDIVDAQTTPSYSLILFGPPGTAKTTICTSIATYLGWKFVTIDTACFLADGLENIASRMVYIFERLKALEKTIILFDEIEEFCLDRENDKLAMESRMLTTAMLTQLNDLRRQQSCIFIVATNRIRSFDAAVTRPGRFDMILFVGTPNLNARLKRLKNKLLGTRLSPEDIASTIMTAQNYLNGHWVHVRFFTFAENELFLNMIIQKMTQSGDVSEEYLDSVVGNIGRTSTIQGYVKEDYIASEVLSRL